MRPYTPTHTVGPGYGVSVRRMSVKKAHTHTRRKECENDLQLKISPTRLGVCNPTLSLIAPKNNPLSCVCVCKLHKTRLASRNERAINQRSKSDLGCDVCLLLVAFFWFYFFEILMSSMMHTLQKK